MSRTNWVLLGFLAVAGFFLVMEHRAHLFGILPFLLVLACVLVYLFHRAGQEDEFGGDGGNGPAARAENRAESPKRNGHV